MTSEAHSTREQASQPPQRQWRWLTVTACFAALLSLCLWAREPVADSPEVDAFLERFKGGTLIIGGGGPTPPEVRTRFIELAGGSQARIVVIPAFEPDPVRVAAVLEPWKPFYAGEMRVLHAKTADEANQDEFAREFDSVTAVWLTGGIQARLAERYAGTKVERQLKKLLDRGGVIGGTSAGAAVMSKVMIEQGKETATLSKGLDLLANSIIDQHFMSRNRANRLMRATVLHPKLIGFGIDESTALVVQVHQGRIGVLGTSYVMAYVPETESGEERFEFLKRGDSIDLEGLRRTETKVGPTQVASDLADD